MDVKYCMSSKKRKDGRYQGYAYIPGETEKKYVYDSDKQICRQKLAELVDELENGILNSKVTLSTYIAKWLNIYCNQLSPTTQHNYSGFCKNVIVPKLGHKKLKDIRNIDIQNLINEFRVDKAEKTTKNLKGCIHKIFDCAIADKLIKTNPAERIKIKRSEPYNYYIYNIDEMKKLLDLYGTDRNAIPVVLAALCGLRASEVTGLKWKDIDFDNNTLTVNRACVAVGKNIYEKSTKTKSSVRTIYMPAYVSYILSLYASEPENHVYPRKDGSVENVINISRRFNNFLLKHNLPKTRFHDLRHFNATTMMIGGIPDKQIASQLGHADTNITKKYQHILKSMEDKPAKLFDTVIYKNDFDVKLDVKYKKKA